MGRGVWFKHIHNQKSIVREESLGGPSMASFLERLLAWLRGSEKKEESAPYEEPEPVEGPEAQTYAPMYGEYVPEEEPEEPVEEHEEPDAVTFSEAAGFPAENEVEA